jgi:hypothetical protein
MLLEPRRSAPVTWLASYPRSGNTLLRVILNRCFGLTSQSIYSDEEFSGDELRGLVGHEAVGHAPREFLDRARSERRRLFVKTHELPPGDHHPAIYVVRDGRSAVVSHTHFLRETFGRSVALADVIGGKVGVSWSQHVQAWRARPGTLFLRYENLAAGEAKTMAALSAFLDLEQQCSFDISFDRLHRLAPLFFRRGSDDVNISEMDAEMEQLFRRLHGPTLHALGYGRDEVEAGWQADVPL